LRLLLSYDGTDFAGYQVQPGPRTVQGVVGEALARLAGGPVALRAAGRTDAGVHALGQVVSVAGWTGPSPEEALRSLNRMLPPDVAVLDAQAGPYAFDARASARWRSYTYLIWNSDSPDPMLRRHALWVRRPVDVQRFAEALDVMAGTHDFTSFARVRDDQTPQRTVLEVAVRADGPLIRVRIVAESFLHQMVRSVVGSGLEVAEGRRSVSWMREALLARDRSTAGAVAPPHGLALVDVGYEDAPWPRRRPAMWPWASTEAGTTPRVAGGMS
jgi:tRNA pseudouridine38-40 synthase